MRPNNGPTVAEGGFTLVEMIVVLAIMGFVGAVVLTRGPAHSAAVDMRMASATVAQALRAARGRAIATNLRVPVRFDPASSTVRVSDGAVQALPPGIRLAVVAAQDRAQGQDQGAVILFLPDGSSTGGRVELAGEGRSALVGVDWLTGRVSVGP